MEPHVSVNLGTPNTVTVTGDLDLVGVPLLQGLLSRLPDGGDLVIDLSGVTFIDCTGLGALVTAHRQTQARGGSFRVAHVPPRVRRVLELTGVNLPTRCRSWRPCGSSDDRGA
jgi:anti-anti-sigma factor